MADPEEGHKQGKCYIFLISCLFIFTFSGAIFLVLYMIQPDNAATPWYPVIGVALVCLPWFFWLLTFLYRIVSRSFGFRIIFFGPFSGGRNVAGDGDGGGGDKSGEAVEERRQAGSPRRVHFGGTVVLGEEDGGPGRTMEVSRSLSSSSSSSSSSSRSSRHSNESELPLKLSIGS